jgi:hypothetical protein
LRRFLQAAGIWDLQAERLAAMARSNGRDRAYLQEWVGWLNRQTGIENTAAYLAQVIRANSDLPGYNSRPQPGSSQRENRPAYRGQYRENHPAYRETRLSYEEEYRRRTEKLVASARKYGRAL